MEFDEIQAIWDTQNNKPMYAMNEEALHNRIVSKKYQISCIASFSEWAVALSSLLVGAFSFWMNYGFVLAVWMLVCIIYVVAGRIQRLQEARRHDRSMQGDLQSALATARYQVRLGQIMRWNIVPLGILMITNFWGTWWLIAATVVFVLLTFYASKWELNIYKRKEQELEILLGKLQQR